MTPIVTSGSDVCETWQHDQYLQRKTVVKQNSNT